MFESKAGTIVAGLGATAIVCVTLLAHSAEAPVVQPGDLVRQTVNQEMTATQKPTVRHMFESRKQSSRGSQTKLYCETEYAMAGMAIAYDDKPLTPEQRQLEEARLNQLLKDPAELARKRQREKEDADRINRIVKAMPDAFFYEYDGTEPAQPGLGKEGSQLVRLKFRPNPKYDPPSHVEQILQGMQGHLLIDPRQHRIARIDGTLLKDVGFGWGILGHLDKGGHFLVEQADVGDGTWDISRMSLTFTGKILLFKRLDIKSTEVFSEFRSVPVGLSFAQAIDLLKKQEAALAQNQRSDASPK